MVVSNAVRRSLSSFKLFYKGSTLEITRLEDVPDDWNVSFDIPPSTFYPNGLGRIEAVLRHATMRSTGQEKRLIVFANNTFGNRIDNQLVIRCDKSAPTQS